MLIIVSREDPTNYVLMLISLSGIATTSEFQKNICFKMRAVGVIKINTKERKGGRWRSGESTCLPPMWPGFDSQTLCHMWLSGGTVAQRRG